MVAVVHIIIILAIVKKVKMVDLVVVVAGLAKAPVQHLLEDLEQQVKEIMEEQL